MGINSGLIVSFIISYAMNDFCSWFLVLFLPKRDWYIYGLLQDCNISIANVQEIQQSLVKRSICCIWLNHWYFNNRFMLSDLSNDLMNLPAVGTLILFHFPPITKCGMNYPFLNFKSEAVYVWEWIGKFTLYIFTWYVITYPCWD